jgi:hypothetical protein
MRVVISFFVIERPPCMYLVASSSKRDPRPQKKMSCAKDLLTSCNQIPYIEESEKTKIRYSALKCLTKWNFSRSEKIQLIKECICPPNSSQVVEEFMVNMYLEIF